MKTIYKGNKGKVELEQKKEKENPFYLKVTIPTGSFVAGQGKTIGEAIADLVESTVFSVLTDNPNYPPEGEPKVNPDLEKIFNRRKMEEENYEKL